MAIVRKVATRKTKGGAKVETNVTVDFTGTSPADVQELAASTVIINEQAVWRVGSIPTGDYTIKVAEQLARPRGVGGFKPMTPESVLAKAQTDPAFMAALKAALANKK